MHVSSWGAAAPETPVSEPPGPDVTSPGAAADKLYLNNSQKHTTVLFFWEHKVLKADCELTENEANIRVLQCLQTKFKQKQTFN